MYWNKDVNTFFLNLDLLIVEQDKDDYYLRQGCSIIDIYFSILDKFCLFTSIYDNQK